MMDKQRIVYLTLWTTAVVLLAAPQWASAENGFYIGGSIGGATIEADLGEHPDFPDLPDGIDEDDTGYKIFAGFLWENPVVDLGVEGGYVDFGEPEVKLPLPTPGGSPIEFDPTGFSVFGVAGIDVGPVGLFAKAGYIFWDIEARIPGIPSSISDDGQDLGYGLGAAVNLGSFQIRGELELFDIDDADVSMLSLGVAYRF